MKAFTKRVLLGVGLLFLAAGAASPAGAQEAAHSGFWLSGGLGGGFTEEDATGIGFH